MPPSTRLAFYSYSMLALTQVLSYGWLTAKHPDPFGYRLKKLQAYFKVRPAAALFWDFGSCPQKDRYGARSEDDLKKFDACLSVMGRLYGSPTTQVIQLKSIPEAPEECRAVLNLYGLSSVDWPSAQSGRAAPPADAPASEAARLEDCEEAATPTAALQELRADVPIASNNPRPHQRP